MNNVIRGYIFGPDGEFYPGEIAIEEDRHIITAISRLDCGDLTAEERSFRIIPGLVDVHSHGCKGHDTCEASEDELLAMVEYERSIGVTSYCPTTMTYDEAKLTEICARVKNVKKQMGETSNIKGIYLEGPFISKEKKGAQNEKYIKPADVETVRRLNEVSGGLVKVVAIAPETEGAINVIESLHGEVRVSLAHTAASYDIAKEAFLKGAGMVTHLYNAMPAYNHRQPGVVGAAFDAESFGVKVMSELICDGIHVHDAVIRNTFRILGDERVIMISDSMEAAGMPDGVYSLGGQTVYKNGKKATLTDGTIAGSASTLYDCFRHALEIGVPMKTAIWAATRNPARAIGIDGEVGTIEIGKRADLLVMNEAYELLRVI